MPAAPAASWNDGAGEFGGATEPGSALRGEGAIRRPGTAYRAPRALARDRAARAAAAREARSCLSQRRPETHTIDLNDSDTARDGRKKIRLPNEPPDHFINHASGCVIGQPQDDDSAMILGRLLPSVGEVEIASEEDGVGQLRTRGDIPIRCRGEPDIAGEFDLMPEAPQERRRRTRHICVDQKPHAALGDRKRVEGFLLGDLADESQGSANVIRRDIVFTLDLLERHAPCEAADDDRHRYARPADHRFSVGDSRVDNDTRMVGHDCDAPDIGIRLNEIDTLGEPPAPDAGR